MFGRAAIYDGPPDKLDAAISAYREQALPASRDRPGFEGGILLVDRQAGRGVSVAYYADQAGLDANREFAKELGKKMAAALGFKQGEVREGEMVILERSAAPQSGTWIRMNSLTADPGKLEETIRFVREKVLPTLKSQPGFRSLVMSVNRQSGEASVASGWTTRDDMRASEKVVTGQRREATEIAGAGPAEVQEYEVAVVEIKTAASAGA